MQVSLLLTALLVGAPAPPKVVAVFDTSSQKQEAPLTAALGQGGQGLQLVPLVANMADGARAPTALREQAIQAWHAGKSLALRLETDHAIERYDEAINLFARAMDSLDDLQPVAQCYLDIGAAWLDKRRSERATAAFTSALVLAPALAPDPNLYNPDVVAQFKRTKHDLARAPRSFLTVVPEPSDAVVLIDGKRAGQGPVSLRDVIVGDHWLVVRRDGYESFGARVAVGKEDGQRMEVFLRAQPPAATMQKILQAAIGAGTDAAATMVQLAKERSAVGVIVLAGQPATARVFRLSDESFSQLFKGEDARVDRLATAARSFLLEEGLSVDVTHPPATGASPLVAWLPLGIGQYARGDGTLGTIFLTTQVILAGINAGSYFAMRADRRSDGTYNNPGRDRLLQVSTNVSFALLVADVLVGSIEGLWRRNARADD